MSKGWNEEIVGFIGLWNGGQSLYDLDFALCLYQAAEVKVVYLKQTVDILFASLHTEGAVTTPIKL